MNIYVGHHIVAGKVLDNRDLPVRDIVEGPIGTGYLGRPDPDRGHGSLNLADSNCIPNVKLLLEQDEKTVDQVADEALGPQS